MPIPQTDIITVLAAIAAVFFVLAFGGKAVEGYRVQRYNAVLRAEVAALREEQESLKKRLEHVQTPEYIEEVAREQYKWVKPGENPIISIFRSRPIMLTTPTLVSQPEALAASSLSHWPEWFDLLKGNR
nr:septum formation initiator family protein [Chloroflexota bacterium]